LSKALLYIAIFILSHLISAQITSPEIDTRDVFMVDPAKLELLVGWNRGIITLLTTDNHTHQFRELQYDQDGNLYGVNARRIFREKQLIDQNRISKVYVEARGSRSGKWHLRAYPEALSPTYLKKSIGHEGRIKLIHLDGSEMIFKTITYVNGTYTGLTPKGESLPIDTNHMLGLRLENQNALTWRLCGFIVASVGVSFLATTTFGTYSFIQVIILGLN
jgi:hypothetical protein